MKKMNNKGYMLVEIIIASVITFTIAYSLMNLIIKFKDKNEDLYNETAILNDKIGITKNIMNDLKEEEIISINNGTRGNKKYIDFTLTSQNGTSKTKRLEINKDTVTYGDYEGTKFITGNKSYYKKTISNSTDIGEAQITNDNNILSITIPISSIYSSKKHDIKLVLKSNTTPVIQKVSENQDDKIWKHKGNAEQIIFQNKIEPISGAEEYDISSLGTGAVMAYVKDNIIYIQSNGNIIANTDSSYLFSGFTEIKKIQNLQILDTSNVTNMSSMFENTSKIEMLNIANWNTSNVTNMSNMFKGAGFSASSWSLNLYNWNPTNVTDMSSMFENAGHDSPTWSIGSIANWNTTNVTNMSNMFKNAGYTTLNFSIGDLYNWNTRNVTNMSGMFENAGYNSQTWNIGDISNWVTDNVTDMSNMFKGAGHNAETNWYIGNLKIHATDISSMFQNSPYAKAELTIYNSPSNYSNVFKGAATISDSQITVKYSKKVTDTNINDILAQKSDTSNIIKGKRID